MKPIILLTISYILGIGIGEGINIPFYLTFIVEICLFILSFIFFVKKLLLLTNISLFLNIILVGVLFSDGHSEMLSSHSLFKYLGQEITLIGDISNPPEISENKTSLIVKADKIGDQKVNGLVLINIKSSDVTLKYGDRVRLIGKLRMPCGFKNPGGFDYQKYLVRKKINALVWIQDKNKIIKLGVGNFNPIFMVAYKIRDRVSDIIYATLPDKPFACASLLDGILLGKRSQLSDEVMSWFQDTGTLHILAISGFNVGIIGLIFFFIFHKLIRLSQRISSFLTLLVLIVFTIMTGATPSVVRATIMAATIIMGKIIDRDTNIYNSLALSALIILLHNPLTLFDIGFQLSFGAVLSLVYFTPFLEPKLWFFPRYLAKLVSVSLAVQIGISPIIIFYFNKLSLVTILANIIVVPLVGFILTIGLGMVFIGIIFIPLANLIGIINFYLISGLFLAVSFFAHIPFAYLYLPTPSFPLLTTYYLCLWAISKHKKIGTSKVIIGILIIGNIFLWVEVIKTSSGIMKVTFLDVGMGDAIFLEFPDGGNMLIDGGPGDYPDAGEMVILPFLRSSGITSLDTVILSHHHSDHYGGLLTLIKNYKIKKFVLDNGATEQKFSQIIKEKAVVHKVVKRGDKIIGYPKIEIYLLHPLDIKDKISNDDSVVVKIVYNQVSFLFTGDIENKAERELLPFKEMLSSTVLKIPHHGSKDGYDQKFIDLVHPKIGVIEVGKDNKFNLPNKQVLKNYEKIGTRIYRTDKDGAVIVTTNGKKVWIKTMRSEKKINNEEKIRN